MTARRLWVVPVVVVVLAGVEILLHTPARPVGAHVPHRPGQTVVASAPAMTPIAMAPTALPGGFAPGACVAFPPTNGDRRLTVFLDAGHGGPDPGAATGTTDTGQVVEEKSVTLPVVLDTATLLRADGYRVVLSRTVDTAIIPLTPADLDGTVLTTQGKHDDLVARVRCANAAGAAMLLSVHFDAFSDSSVRGATTLYDSVRPFSAANLRLATLVQNDVVDALDDAGWQVPDRGVADDTTAGGGEITGAGIAYGHLDLLGPPDPGYVDQPTTMPGALVEPLFLTNAAEATVAADPIGQQTIAQGITQAAESFLGQG